LFNFAHGRLDLQSLYEIFNGLIVCNILCRLVSGGTLA